MNSRRGMSDGMTLYRPTRIFRRIANYSDSYSLWGRSMSTENAAVAHRRYKSVCHHQLQSWRVI